MKNKELKILLAAPRGFCAGVERAIEIVKKSIDKYGAPVYVRHEIVHNKHVVDGLKKLVQFLSRNLKKLRIILDQLFFLHTAYQSLFPQRL